MSRHRLWAAALLFAAAPVAVVAADNGTPQAPDAPAPYQPGTVMDPEANLVATVEGRGIYLKDLSDALREQPEDLQRRPFDLLFPGLLNDAINHTALLLEAQRQGLDTDPDIRRRMTRAANIALENEWLERVVSQRVTEAAIRARYNEQYSGQQGVEERRLRIIVLKTRDAAAAAAQQLADGGDFVAIARELSIDPSSINGGEIGFVTRDRLPPELAGPAFAAAIGAVWPVPIAHRGAWYVVAVEESKLVPVPPYDDVRLAIKSKLVREAIDQEVQRARASVEVRSYNLNGQAATPPQEEPANLPFRVEASGPK
jgi:peptidyl-prolyl cis-trans isomerase C